MTLVACYTTSNKATDNQKETFYNELTSVLKDVPRHDILCVMGDFNAKVGNDREYCVDVLGNHGLGDRNENGELLIEMAPSFGLVVGSTLFAHKDIHKYSWTSSNGHTKNQIDTFLIGKKWQTSLCDVRAFRGADIFSDHSLMAAKIRVKLSAPRKVRTARQRPYDCEKLSDLEIRSQFVLKLTNRFETLGLLRDESPETAWTAIRNAYNDTTYETLGMKKVTKS